ncbi:MAG: precorrin-3B synthase [Methylobacteriaceae bacterium]|nr:precorrin-3B synthase [Methylobacteriaceae bacterium]MBV9705640.1 precorrin-3B synthase [Methylobacteriaceae bacterium]
MSAPALLRKGWCPGALRPMQTGDGLLVRLRPTGGILSFEAARAIAECARQFGNGLIDLTTRANLQLRGLTQMTLGPLAERLSEQGLIDGDPAAEAVRNVIASPLAGLDASACLDIRPAVAALEKRLTDDPSLHRLPARFLFLIDDGGGLSLGDVDADIRFDAVSTTDGPRFVVSLAGHDETVCVCASWAVPEVAAAIAEAFLSLGGGAKAPQRVRDLSRPLCAHWAEIFARREAAAAESGAFSLGVPPQEQSAGLRRVKRTAPGAEELLGTHSFGARCRVGAAAPFGRLTAGDLDRLAGIAARCGARDLRVTPWRAILVTGLSESSAQALLAGLSETDLILDPVDTRLLASACPGAPACASATIASRRDATRLAPLLRRMACGGPVLHVSGCAKGCGQSRPAPITLVGNAGCYDLVRDATARDVPVAAGLSLNAVEVLLRRLLENPAEKLVVGAR